MEFDSDENGGKLTTRDVWRLANHTALKLVVAKARDVDGEIFDGCYNDRAWLGAKYRCEKTETEWFIEFGEHPCKYCLDKEGCNAETLEKLESDVLILDFQQEQDKDEGDER